MIGNRRQTAIIAAAGLTVVGLAASAALATSNSGVTAVPVSTGHFAPLDVKADKDGKWDLFLKTKAATIVGVDKLTIAPGGHIGWHSHKGPVLANITAGTIVVSFGEPGCPSKTLHAGDTHVEPANRVHYVDNPSATDPAEFIAVQLRPEGQPGRIDQDVPEECQQP